MPAMPLPSLPLSLRLSLFYTAYFLVIGIQLPFWPLWLESRGLTAAEIGLVLSVSLWVRIVTIPVAGVVVDRTGNRRGALIVLSASSLAASLMYPPIDGFWPILLVTVLVSAFFSPVMNLGDNLTLLIARANRLDYGRMRLWGSISFIAAAGLGGVMAAPSGPEVGAVPADRRHRPDGGGILPAAEAPPPKPASSPLAGTAGRGRVMMLMTDPAFLLFLGATAAIQSSHAVYYAFGTLHWRELGHSEAVIGWLWAEGVIAEILLFAFGTALGARLSPARLLMVAGLAGTGPLDRHGDGRNGAGTGGASGPARADLRRRPSGGDAVYRPRHPDRPVRHRPGALRRAGDRHVYRPGDDAGGGGL